MALRRSMKNVVKGYLPIERDVREATSNDAWAAPQALLARIADASCDLTQLPLIMGIIWKRLDDSGKNWRHVYKSLALLEYMVRCGGDQVPRVVAENMFSIQTLRDFQYVSKEGKDVGLNIRERAKQLCTLMEDRTALAAIRHASVADRMRFHAVHPDSRFRANPSAPATPSSMPPLSSSEQFSPSQPTTTSFSPSPASPPASVAYGSRRLAEADRATLAAQAYGITLDPQLEVQRRARSQQERQRADTALEAQEEAMLAMALEMSRIESEGPAPFHDVAPEEPLGDLGLTEEEQLQLAMQLSAEQAEKDEKARKRDTEADEMAAWVMGTSNIMDASVLMMSEMERAEREMEGEYEEEEECEEEEGEEGEEEAGPAPSPPLTARLRNVKQGWGSDPPSPTKPSVPFFLDGGDPFNQ